MLSQNQDKYAAFAELDTTSPAEQPKLNWGGGMEATSTSAGGGSINWGGWQPLFLLIAGGKFCCITYSVCFLVVFFFFFLERINIWRLGF
jgi:hypothetical protein